ncbi:MAG: TolC family protein [Nitrospirota bacterium]
MRYLIIGFLLLFSVPAVFAAQGMSLEDAEKLFLENNLELKAKKAELGKYDAGMAEAGLLPNPSFNYNIESVENGERETEEVYTISQPIDIVRKRGLRTDVARKKRDARYLLYEQETLNALAELKQTYYRILYLKENETSLKGILDTFSDVRQKTEERLKAGDVAEVELLKLSNEGKRFSRALESLKAEISAETRKLAVMLNISMDDVALKDSLVPAPFGYSRDELTARAMEKRGDIKAASAQIDAAGAALTLSKKDAVSPIEIEAGYKRRTGGFNGFAFGVSIPLPLFNRNQGGITAAKAELEAERINLEQLKKKAASEVATHADRATFNAHRVAQLSEQLTTANEITNSIRIAYDEGEASLIELLDAVRSERELLMEHNEAVYDYWTTLFELEKATGMKLTKGGGAQ